MSERIVRLKIVLDDTDPPIWRAVELSAATDLKGLHRVIQAAMGWEEAHLHAFQHGRRKLGDRVRLDELVDGAGRCPPEDCGGIPGFYALLEALADPDHPDHDDLMDWHGGAFDAENMDAKQINKRLAHIATRRKRAAAKPRS